MVYCIISKFLQQFQFKPWILYVLYANTYLFVFSSLAEGYSMFGAKQLTTVLSRSSTSPATICYTYTKVIHTHSIFVGTSFFLFSTKCIFLTQTLPLKKPHRKHLTFLYFPNPLFCIIYTLCFSRGPKTCPTMANITSIITLEGTFG